MESENIKFELIENNVLELINVYCSICDDFIQHRITSRAGLMSNFEGICTHCLKTMVNEALRQKIKSNLESIYVLDKIKINDKKAETFNSYTEMSSN